MPLSLSGGFEEFSASILLRHGLITPGGAVCFARGLREKRPLVECQLFLDFHEPEIAAGVAAAAGAGPPEVDARQLGIQVVVDMAEARTELGHAAFKVLTASFRPDAGPTIITMTSTLAKTTFRRTWR